MPACLPVLCCDDVRMLCGLQGNGVNAASPSEIGKFDLAKYKDVRLGQSFNKVVRGCGAGLRRHSCAVANKQVARFNHISTVALQKEIVDVGCCCLAICAAAAMLVDNDANRYSPSSMSAASGVLLLHVHRSPPAGDIRSHVSAVDGVCDADMWTLHHHLIDADNRISKIY